MTHAEIECLRCRGRLFGDCDSVCRYWLATASRAELEREARREANATTKVRPRKHVRLSRAWMFKARNGTWPKEGAD